MSDPSVETRAFVLSSLFRADRFVQTDPAARLEDLGKTGRFIEGTVIWLP